MTILSASESATAVRWLRHLADQVADGKVQVHQWTRVADIAEGPPTDDGFRTYEATGGFTVTIEGWQKP